MPAADVGKPRTALAAGWSLTEVEAARTRLALTWRDFLAG